MSTCADAEEQRLIASDLPFSSPPSLQRLIASDNVHGKRAFFASDLSLSSPPSFQRVFMFISLGCFSHVDMDTAQATRLLAKLLFSPESLQTYGAEDGTSKR